MTRPDRHAAGGAPTRIIIVARSSAPDSSIAPPSIPRRRPGGRRTRRAVWPSWTDALLLAATAAILTLAALRQPDLLQGIGAPLRLAMRDRVRAPDAAFPYRLRHAPTITAATYRAALAEANHPMAAEADALYDLLVASGVDPAPELALALVTHALDPDAVRPPPVGGRNVHGMLRPDGAPVTYDSYRDAVAAWIAWVVAASPAPDAPDAPLTLAGIVALHCAAPACPAEELLTAMTRAVDAWRAADAPRRR